MARMATPVNVAEAEAPDGVDGTRPRHSDGLSTVRHALRVLELLATHDGLSVKQVAAEVGRKLGTVYHVVNTLLDDGYLTRSPGGALHLGERLPRLLEQLDQRMDPYPELNQVLARLALATGSTAVLGELVGRQVMLASVQSFPGAAHQRLLRSGMRGPAHSMALGKVLMAGLPRRQVTDLLDDWVLVRLTERTIDRRDDLREAIEFTARSGFGLDLEEGLVGLTCIAAPIWTPAGRPPAAIAVGITPDEFKAGGTRLIRHVVEAARRSSLVLGRSVGAAPSNFCPSGVVAGRTSGKGPAQADGAVRPPS
jgi:DNA-binding IclR family transcriptional regulator